MSDMYPSKWLSSSDLPKGKEFALVIADVQMQSFEDGGVEKPALFFDKAKKGMILNKTNADVLSESFGDDSDNWLGKRIVVYSGQVRFKGQLVPCLRLKVPTQAAPDPVPTPAKPLAASPDIVPEVQPEDIPF